MGTEICTFKPVGFTKVTLSPGNCTAYELSIFGPMPQTPPAAVEYYLITCSVGRRAAMIHGQGPLGLDYVREEFGVNWTDAAEICKGIGEYLKRPYQLETGLWSDYPSTSECQADLPLFEYSNLEVDERLSQ